MFKRKKEKESVVIEKHKNCCGLGYSTQKLLHALDEETKKEK